MTDERAAEGVMTIETIRLQLTPFDPAHLLALIEGTEPFEACFGLPAAEGLRAFIVSEDVSPAWLAQLRASSTPDPWLHGYAVVDRECRAVVGMVGFKGAPDAEGIVEIGYGIAPGFEGRGYATEAARAVVAFALGDHRVIRVRAHTLPTPNASTRVLAKCGFQRIGEVEDPEDGLVWRWERVGEDRG
jgi:[ribosomal protein S5]-alanine N-acetyltransferase